MESRYEKENPRTIANSQLKQNFNQIFQYNGSPPGNSSKRISQTSRSPNLNNSGKNNQNSLLNNPNLTGRNIKVSYFPLNLKNDLNEFKKIDPAPLQVMNEIHLNSQSPIPTLQKSSFLGSFRSSQSPTNNPPLSDAVNSIDPNQLEIQLRQLDIELGVKKDQLDRKQRELQIYRNQLHDNSTHGVNFQGSLSKIYNEYLKKIDSLMIEQLKQRSEKKRIEELLQEKEQMLEESKTKLHLIQNEKMRLDNNLEKKEHEIYDEFEIDFEKIKREYALISEKLQEFLKEKEQLQQEFNESLETKAMFKEDLNGRLLQRAELVAQQQDYEQMFDLSSEENYEESQYLANEKELSMKSTIQQKNVQRMKNDLKSQLQEKENLYNEMLKNGEKIDELSIRKSRLQDNFQCEDIQEFIQKQQGLELFLNKLALSSLKLPQLKAIGRDFLQDCRIQVNQQKFARAFNYNILTEMIRVIFFPEENQNEETPNVDTNLQGLWNYVETKFLDPLAQSHQNLPQKDIQVYKSSFVSYIQFEIDLFKMRQQFIDEYEILQNEINIENQQLQKRSFRLNDLEKQITDLENEQNQQSQQLKHIDNQIMCLDKNFDIMLQSKAESAFKQYLESQKESFKNLIDMYGQEEAKQLENENYNQFYQLIKNRSHEILNGFQQIQNRIVYYENIIQINVKTVDDEILPQLKALVSTIDQMKQMLESLQSQEAQFRRVQSEQEIEVVEFKKQLDKRLTGVQHDFGIRISQLEQEIEQGKVHNKSIENQIGDLERNRVNREQKLQNQTKLESELRIEMESLNSKRHLGDDMRMRPTDIKEQTVKREMEISELEEDIIKLLNIRKSVEETILFTPQCGQNSMSRNETSPFFTGTGVVKNYGSFCNNNNNIIFSKFGSCSTVKARSSVFSPIQTGQTTIFGEFIKDSNEKRHNNSLNKNNSFTHNMTSQVQQQVITNPVPVAKFNYCTSVNSGSLNNSISKDSYRGGMNTQLQSDTNFFNNYSTNNSSTSGTANSKPSNGSYNSSFIKQSATQIETEQSKQLNWK